jgi:hypothetical protein
MKTYLGDAKTNQITFSTASNMNKDFQKYMVDETKELKSQSFFKHFLKCSYLIEKRFYPLIFLYFTPQSTQRLGHLLHCFVNSS